MNVQSLSAICKLDVVKNARKCTEFTQQDWPAVFHTLPPERILRQSLVMRALCKSLQRFLERCLDRNPISLYMLKSLATNNFESAPVLAVRRALEDRGARGGRLNTRMY
jgi:hypothetical protein